jgi:hypothetical protein
MAFLGFPSRNPKIVKFMNHAILGVQKILVLMSIGELSKKKLSPSKFYFLECIKIPN